MNRIYGGGILYSEFHPDVVHKGTDKGFHIRYVAAFQLTGVMRFIVADPNGAAGKCGYGSVFDIVRDAFSQRETLNFGAFFGMRVLAIVFDQEFQSFPITDAGNLVKMADFSFASLVIDFYELRRQR